MWLYACHRFNDLRFQRPAIRKVIRQTLLECREALLKRHPVILRIFRAHIPPRRENMAILTDFLQRR